jgi:hypothetical protein
MLESTMSTPLDETPLDQPLIGGDFAAVRARYGAPLGCSHEEGVLRLTYLGPDGNAIDGAIELTDGVVATEHVGLHPTPTGSGDRCVGQPIECILPRLGAPDRVVSRDDCTRLEFADCVVTVYGGVIVCVVPILPSVTAPTPRASA